MTTAVAVSGRRSLVPCSNESPSDLTKDEVQPALLSQPKPEEPLNVMSFNDFSDGPELVDTNDVLETTT